MIKSKLFFLPLLFICALVVIICSCNKEKIHIQLTPFPLQAATELNGIDILHQDTIAVCGGSRYFQGDIYMTYNRGVSWFAYENITNKALYRIKFSDSKNIYAVGFEGKLLHSNDCGVTWNFRQTDYKAFRDIYFLKNEMILCGGSGFNRGIIYRLDMNENILQRDTFANELHALCFLDSTIGFCAGYGLILKTTDAGKTWNATNAQGDFFKSIQCADGKIFALGNNGLLIYSDDEGDTWKKDLHRDNAFQFTNALNFLSVNNNQSLICGDNGKTFYNNGNKWLSLKTSLNIDFTSSIFTADKFYLTARDGKIYSGTKP